MINTDQIMQYATAPQNDTAFYALLELLDDTDLDRIDHLDFARSNDCSPAFIARTLELLRNDPTAAQTLTRLINELPD